MLGFLRYEDRMSTADTASSGIAAKRGRPRHDALSAADVTAIPALEAIVGYRLRRAQLYVFQDFIDSFARMKLRPAEFSVLSVMARRPGLKQTEIAEELGIKRANFVALMDGLEARGLAERRKADTDKRSHSLHLTPDGVKFVRKMMEVWNEHEKRLVDKLGGAEERDRLIQLLDRIVAPDSAPR
jgi:DNA-binding MarR family transcriptional regulator